MRLCPSCRGETTPRSSHHCNWRRLTPQMRATSLLLNPCASEEDASRDFLPLNISRHFRCVNLPPPWIVHAPPAVSIGGESIYNRVRKDDSGFSGASSHVISAERVRT